MEWAWLTLTFLKYEAIMKSMIVNLHHCFWGIHIVVSSWNLTPLGFCIIIIISPSIKRKLLEQLNKHSPVHTNN